jgi:phenylpropionate dioxygenase-like ring-hydroxylating dioxygenase large terminal subunit
MNKGQNEQANEETGRGSSLDKVEANMREHWYPLSLSKHLIADTPVGLHLLGGPVVLFRDRKGRSC